MLSGSILDTGASTNIIYFKPLKKSFEDRKRDSLYFNFKGEEGTAILTCLGSHRVGDGA